MGAGTSCDCEQETLTLDTAIQDVMYNNDQISKSITSLQEDKDTMLSNLNNNTEDNSLGDCTDKIRYNPSKRNDEYYMENCKKTLEICARFPVGIEGDKKCQKLLAFFSD